MKNQGEWIEDKLDNIPFQYRMNGEGRYEFKILIKVPRRFYYSILNDIGLYIESKMQENDREGV